MNAELYRSYAQECLHFASGMETPESKAVLVAMAETWLRLASRAEKNERGSADAGGSGVRGDALLDPPGL